MEGELRREHDVWWKERKKVAGRSGLAEGKKMIKI